MARALTLEPRLLSLKSRPCLIPTPYSLMGVGLEHRRQRVKWTYVQMLEPRVCGGVVHACPGHTQHLARCERVVATKGSAGALCVPAFASLCDSTTTIGGSRANKAAVLRAPGAHGCCRLTPSTRAGFFHYVCTMAVHPCPCLVCVLSCSCALGCLRSGRLHRLL